MAENKNYKFVEITPLNLKQMGVQALADRPNAAQQYGQSGLSPTELKRWFDKLATLLTSRLNTLQNAINGEEAAKYIGIAIGEYKTLDALLLAMQNGKFAAEILKLWPNENHHVALEPSSLQDIIYGVAKSISGIEENIDRLDDDKLGKVTEGAAYKRVYAVDDKGDQTMLSAAATPAGNMPLYSANGALIAKMSPIPGMPGAEVASEVVNMAFIQELRKHIGAGVRFTMDPTTFIVSIDVLNIEGTVIYHTELDLPLEEFAIGASYDNGVITITLKNGQTLEIPVVNIVNGLVTQARYEEDMKDLNGKVDARFKAYIDDVYALVGGDYVDYS